MISFHGIPIAENGKNYNACIWHEIKPYAGIFFSCGDLFIRSVFGIAFNEKGKQEYDCIYDPQKYADMYYGADGKKPQDKINALRRARYQLNKDYINAQKRDTYQARVSEEALKTIIESGIHVSSDTLENGIINIEIDEIVPCLRDLKTGEYVDTTANVIVDRKVLKGFNKRTGWYINWQQVPRDCTIVALKVKGKDEIQGLVAFKGVPEHSAVMGHWAVSNPKSNKLLTLNPEYSGIGGHLFAIMAEASVQMGYDGFVEGMAANQKLFNYYKDFFGAKPLGGLKFYIDENAAKELIEKYNWEK